MEKDEVVTRAQKSFLRACSTDPAGIAAHKLPAPATFRRWMRRPGFRRAIKHLRDALRFQADLHLAAAAAQATRDLGHCTDHATTADATPTANGGAAPAAAAAAAAQARQRQVQAAAALLRLSHARERFSREFDPPEPRLYGNRDHRAIAEFLDALPDNSTVGWARRQLEQCSRQRKNPSR